MRADLKYASLAELGGAHRVADLERLALRIFGEGNRPEGWFARKLRREHVDMDMSVVATTADGDDPEGWQGYALVGRPPSLEPIARAAGFGLVPDLRGSGVGTELVDRTLAAVARRGRTGLRVLAQPNLVPFYERLGFAVLHGWETWRGTAVGDPADELPEPGPWTLPGVQLELCAWMREAWDGTEESLRTTLWYEIDGLEMVAHVSREGRAFLVQRLCVEHPDLVDVALDEVLLGLPADAPVLVTGVKPASLLQEPLAATGFELVQRGFVMDRPVP